jgi:DNA-binding beta-propeller fold protein YncE
MDNQVREYGQQNLTLPHDIVPLPSGGVFYKNKKQSVKVGYLTAMDENIIMAGGADFATNLIRAKMYEPDFKVEEMLEGDVEAILIFLRNTAFGPTITVSTVDPVTKKEFKTDVTLDELNIKKGQNPNEDGTFSITLPMSKANVKVKPLTWGESLSLNKALDTYPAGRVPPTITMKLQKQIVEINGDRTLATISQFVEQMPIADSKFIRQFLNDNEPRLDLKRVVIAPSGEKLTVNVGFGVDFFRPFF